MPVCQYQLVPYSQFTYGVKMTGVAVKSGLLTDMPTRTTIHWAAAGPQRAATIPVIDSFNPYVNWPLAMHG
eukprot:352058-Chlamydomonas_euryale.AAC.4